MKKKLRLFATIGCVFLFGIIIGGCRMPDIASGSLSSNGTIYDLESYKLMGDATFLPLTVQKIDNHNCQPTILTEYVNVKDKTIWLQSYKWFVGSNSGGLGQSMVQELDSEGKPKLYSGDIQELIKQYEKQE